MVTKHPPVLLDHLSKATYQLTFADEIATQSAYKRRFKDIQSQLKLAGPLISLFCFSSRARPHAVRYSERRNQRLIFRELRAQRFSL